MLRLGTCEQVPVTVSRVQWTTRPQRTHTPPAPLIDRWHLEIDLTTADHLVRGAAVLLTDELLLHTRGWADHPSATVTYRVTVSPQGQDRGNGFTAEINTGIRWTITSRTPGTGPDGIVQAIVQVGDQLMTGSVVDLLRFPDTGWTAQVALLVTTNTKNDRTRWHVQEPLGTPSPYDFLRTGRRSGWVALRGEDRHAPGAPC